MQKVRIAFNDALVIALALVSVALLSVELLYDLGPLQWRIVQGLDIAIALTFLGEFIYRLFRAPSVSSFLIYNWWQLLAAIPVTTLPTQILRTLMLLRVAQILRFTSIGARILVPFAPFFSFVYQTRVAAIMSVFLLVFLLGTLTFHIAEVEANPAVSTYWDTVFFASSAVTTSGISIDPVTRIGEAITVVFMFSGVITLGVFAAYLASYLVKHPE